MTAESARSGPAQVGYVIPEFPGQTHIWMWREIVALRDWGVPIRIFSTRRPIERDRARHAFAVRAEAETDYLWPLSVPSVLRAIGWALATHPIGLLRCLGLALTLPVSARYRRVRLVCLIAPACQLARLCGWHGVTHLHSHGCAHSAILCMMVKRLQGTPYSMTLNANIEWWGGAMLEKFGDAEFTIAITQWLLEQIHRDFPTLRPGQALLGRIGVDTTRWAPAAQRRSGEAPVRLITVARLHRNKGHDVLLDALKRLHDDGMEFDLRIIGDGPERSALAAQAARLGIGSRVSFLGSVGEERVIEEMSCSDVFVLPSRFEPLGVAYMEAMAMGVATIGTSSGGVSEIIDDEVDGLLVPPDEVVALATAIRRLSLDRRFRCSLGAAGRKKVVERFDSRVGAATLYERLFGSRPMTASLPPPGQA